MALAPLAVGSQRLKPDGHPPDSEAEFKMEDDKIQDQADLGRPREELDSVSRDQASASTAAQPEPWSSPEQEPADKKDGNTER